MIDKLDMLIASQIEVLSLIKKGEIEDSLKVRVNIQTFSLWKQ